jgi:sodium/potassium/calcium exchanger 6
MVVQVTALIHIHRNIQDFFSSFAAITNGSPSLAFGAILGSGVFVTVVVLAVLTLISNVNVTRRPFFRDTTFFLIMVIVLFAILEDGKVWLWESEVFIAVYIM